MTFRSRIRLIVHPTPILPWVDVSTGFARAGVPIGGGGVALAGKRVLEARPLCCRRRQRDRRRLIGKVDRAGHEDLANLTAIVDVNRLGQRGPTELEWDMGAYAARARAFGVDPIVIDGHDLAEIDDAFSRARKASRPTAVLARTVKGKGVSFIENKEGWHGKALDADRRNRRSRSRRGAIAHVPRSEARALGAAFDAADRIARAKDVRRPDRDAKRTARRSPRSEPRARTWSCSTPRSPTRPMPRLQADRAPSGSSRCTSRNSRWSRPPSECRSSAWSRSPRHRSVLHARLDFIRMAAISRAQIRLVGSHAGVSIGEDGPRRWVSRISR